MKRIALLCLLLSLLTPTAHAATVVKPGARCASPGQIKVVKQTAYACVRKSGKNIWQVRLAKPRPVTPTPPPLTISQRWDTLDPVALSIARKWMSGTVPETHTVNFIWSPSPRADIAAVGEIKRRYDLAARYWSQHATITNPLKVLIGNFNDVEWICAEKLAWLNWNQPDCVDVESNGRSGIPTAGQSQNRTRNVDMYQVDQLSTLDKRFFLGRIEHEFVHNVFHAQWPEYQNGTACWMIEGGAEYFGILVATGKNPDLFIQARNVQASAGERNDRRSSWTVDGWVSYLNETDRTDVANRQGDTCGPVRGIIYQQSILANEYLVWKLGIPGFLNLIREASQAGWAGALERTFGKPKSIVYREIAQYMHDQYAFIHKNPWSYSELQNVPFGR